MFGDRFAVRIHHFGHDAGDGVAAAASGQPRCDPMGHDQAPGAPQPEGQSDQGRECSVGDQHGSERTGPASASVDNR